MELSDFNIGGSKNETAYYMLDILLLLGDPTQSVTQHDDYNVNGTYNVGAYMPDKLIECSPTPEDYVNEKVRVDRTS